MQNNSIEKCACPSGVVFGLIWIEPTVYGETPWINPWRTFEELMGIAEGEMFQSSKKTS